MRPATAALCVAVAVLAANAAHASHAAPPDVITATPWGSKPVPRWWGTQPIPGLYLDLNQVRAPALHCEHTVTTHNGDVPWLQLPAQMQRRRH